MKNYFNNYFATELCAVYVYSNAFNVSIWMKMIYYLKFNLVTN